MALSPDPGAPIGIFDSGVGGLTVVKEIRRHLPGEHLIYLGDTARTPYGTKAKETITRFTLECVRHLLTHRIKALVVACNTASAFALPVLRRQLSIPILGVIVPGARAALNCGVRGPIGVIGTRATIHSQAYVKTIRRFQPRARVHAAPCPLLVPLVEEGWLSGEIASGIVSAYLRPILKLGIRSLILGCTHYPALKPVIQTICGERVVIIDSAEELAKELSGALAAGGLKNSQAGKGRQQFLVTDVPEPFIRVGEFILGARLSSVRRISLKERA